MVAPQVLVPRRGETLKESSKEKDVRISNIVAAKGKSQSHRRLMWVGPRNVDRSIDRPGSIREHRRRTLRGSNSID